jgi:hypothetical protein
MMTATVSALSPVNVPEMKYASEIHGSADSMTVHIEKNARDEMYYAFRVGEKAPEKDDTNLLELRDLIARLTARIDKSLEAGGRPPEVRIACDKTLPCERVHELAKELQRLKDKNRIAYYGAEVNEKK